MAVFTVSMFQSADARSARLASDLAVASSSFARCLRSAKGADHAASDAAGDHLPPAAEGYWRDHKSAGVNAMRTSTLIRQCDLAVVRFGDEYRQWNAAFDAGALSALGKPYVTLHGAQHVHALKEVDAGALAWAETVEQVIETLAHVTG